MSKITSADCVEAIRVSPFYAGLRINSVKRRSKRNGSSPTSIVRVFEVIVPDGSLFACVVEDGGQIVTVTPCLSDGTALSESERQGLLMKPDLVAAERQNLRRRVEAYLKPPAASVEAASVEDQDDIDAERFKQMVKKPDAQPEEDIDAERFRRIEKRK